MRNNECRFESQVMEELRSGELSPALNEHVEQCALCRETVELHQWMNGFQASEPLEIESRLPSSDLLWEKAFQQEVSQHTKEIERKAMLPIVIFQTFAILVSLGVVALLLVPDLSPMGKLFNSWIGAGSILDSILVIVRSVMHSFSYLLIPLGIGISSLLISGIAVAVPPRKKL